MPQDQSSLRQVCAQQGHAYMPNDEWASNVCQRCGEPRSGSVEDTLEARLLESDRRGSNGYDNELARDSLARIRELEAAMRKIVELSDLEMKDGDAARDIARAVMQSGT